MFLFLEHISFHQPRILAWCESVLREHAQHTTNGCNDNFADQKLKLLKTDMDCQEALAKLAIPSEVLIQEYWQILHP